MQVTRTTLKRDEFEFRPDWTFDHGVSCPYASGKIPIDLQWEKCCDHSSAFIFEWTFLIVAGINKVNHKSLDAFEFLQDSKLTAELAALECLKNQRLHIFSVAIDLILFKLADKKEMYNILDEFQLLASWTTDNYLFFTIQKSTQIGL